mmetsp:Transcript_11702/g.17575  ORF Transcript_11702/g.17575 Transcript_11702/m.17575 type:complete len:868 (+) Transcript_11702:37-2640(+)
MSSYQVHDHDRVVLVDMKTCGTIENSTRLVVGKDDHQFRLNNKGHELINCREGYHLYGQNCKGILWDEMPSERSNNGYLEAFVQLSSAIAYVLEKEEKIPLIYCKNGRSRSPCVVAAFFIIYRGLTLNEIEVWFKESYPAQRPVTDEISSNFPNLDKFKGILTLLETCLSNPKESIRGFNLAASVANCSEMLGYPLILATRPAAAANLTNLDPLCFPPSMRHIFQRTSTSSPSHKRMTRGAKKRAQERVAGIPSRQKARVSLSPSNAARIDETVEERREDENHETQPSDEDASKRETDETVEEDESHETQPSGENAFNIESEEDETETHETQHSNENASIESDGTSSDGTVEEDESLFFNALRIAGIYQGMKAQTNPNMACITFCDSNNSFVLCTNQKWKESTTSKVLGDTKVVVLQGLDAFKYFVPDMVMHISDSDFDSLSDNELSEELVTIAAHMAIPDTQQILLVCDDAESFGKIASIYASLYLAFRNEKEFDAQKCIESITLAFRQQCPSCFDDNYNIPQIQTFFSALENIKHAERGTLFETKTLETIVRNVHASMMSSKMESYLSREYHSCEEILEWVHCPQNEFASLYPPFSAFLCNDVYESPLDRPDWISKCWPGEGVDLCDLSAPAVNSGSIAACAFLLSEMGKEGFFLDQTNLKNTTPLYNAAKCSDPVLVSWMLNNGGDISLETPNDDGKTPLFAACNYGAIDVVKILILNGATADDMPFFGKRRGRGSGSAFDFLSLKVVENLRLWIKGLMDDGICDNKNRHLHRAHTTILYRYLLLCNDGIVEGQEIDLSSLDHGDHEFLREDDSEDDFDSPSDIEEFAIYEAKKIARASLFGQLYPQLHKLCNYNTGRSDDEQS